MRRLFGAIALVLLGTLAGCVTAPRLRTAQEAPREPSTSVTRDYPVPTPSWPVRWGGEPRETAASVVAPVWVLPDQVLPVVPAVPVVQPAPPPSLPLPEVRPLPVKATPLSRSWTTVTQVKTPAALPLPTAVVPKAAAKTETKAEPKAPTVTAAAPQPAAAAKAPSPPTAAATASLLPPETARSGDFRWEDVNAVAGDSVTLHFEKTNWLYLDSPAQQKTLGFQTINRDKTATTFVFKPLVPGEYTLEFQRQDLVSQSIDARKVKLTVVKPGTRTASTGTSTAPQTSNVPANDALEASRALAASGKTAEAVQRLLQSYKADDARVNLELARLMNQTGQSDEALTYLEKNLTLTGPDFGDTLELGTRLAATRDPVKKLPAYVKLWTAGTSAPTEDLYLQVMETLRTQKMVPLLKDWSVRYTGWYPAPKLRDRYLYQTGLWLEEPGETRDVRGAWKAYNEVVQSFPLSPYWKASGERAAYINRHFLQVR